MFRFWFSCLVFMGFAMANAQVETAKLVLERTCAFFEKQAMFRVVASETLEVTGSVSSRDDIAISLDLDRPTRMRSTQAGKTFEARSINNDEGYFIHIVSRQQYKQEAAKASVSEAVDATAGSPLGSDIRFVTYLLQDNPWAGLQSRMTSMAYVGKEDLAGVPCHHLRLEEEELGWDIWIDDGEVPLPRRIRPDLSKFVESHRAQLGPTTNATLEVNFTWTHPVSFPEGHFKFDPPQDTLFVKEFQAVNPQHPQFQLLATAAPPIVAQTLDGAPKTLKPAAGEIWILDFWAIWCQPCHMLMPVLHEVAEAYADKGVRLYSINVGDDPNAVSAFLVEKSFDTSHALLDSVHRVARDYALESFPMVVLIGKDGTIQTIRSGFGPGYAEQLRKDLDTLVKGESLVMRPKN